MWNSGQRDKQEVHRDGCRHGERFPKSLGEEETEFTPCPEESGRAACPVRFGNWHYAGGWQILSAMPATGGWVLFSCLPTRQHTPGPSRLFRAWLYLHRVPRTVLGARDVLNQYLLYECSHGFLSLLCFLNPRSPLYVTTHPYPTIPQSLSLYISMELPIPRVELIPLSTLTWLQWALIAAYWILQFLWLFATTSRLLRSLKAGSLFLNHVTCHPTISSSFT